MRRFLIEREIPGVGHLSEPDIGEAAATSNLALATLAPRVQWVHSYVAADRTFCIYLAESAEQVRKHAQLAGFPANRIVEVGRMIDPVTANAMPCT